MHSPLFLLWRTYHRQHFLLFFTTTFGDEKIQGKGGHSVESKGNGKDKKEYLSVTRTNITFTRCHDEPIPTA
jgi:hypothetical protein